ncbi:hypothetical protein IU433_03530 [Nocardia puris]|nr:hypothetical protein [Nocardia puris]MBF6368168.1 hypothetical protein [Nocardia puris]MBF6458113.1 hypothetical protein [Nocardia puris]
MMIKKMIAAAVLAVAATTGIATATAHAAPGAVVAGVDRGVEYTAAVAPDRSAATVTLAGGTFEVTPGAVAVRAPDGAVLASLPTSLHTVTGQQVRVVPSLDATATQLTLTPASAPAQPELSFIGDAGTTIAGIAIGCAIGALIGAIFLILPAIPGCIIGAVIGGIIGANA